MADFLEILGKLIVLVFTLLIIFIVGSVVFAVIKWAFSNCFLNI